MKSDLWFRTKPRSRAHVSRLNNTFAEKFNIRDIFLNTDVLNIVDKRMCKAFQHWLPTELDRAKYNMYIYHPDAMKHQTTDELEEIDDLYIHIYIYIQRVRSYVHVKHE